MRSRDNALAACADGVIASNSERTSIRTPVKGAWHMLTLTTMQDGSPVRLRRCHAPHTTSATDLVSTHRRHDPLQIRTSHG